MGLKSLSALQISGTEYHIPFRTPFTPFQNCSLISISLHKEIPNICLQQKHSETHSHQKQQKCHRYYSSYTTDSKCQICCMMVIGSMSGWIKKTKAAMVRTGKKKSNMKLTEKKYIDSNLPKYHNSNKLKEGPVVDSSIKKFIHFFSLS